MKLILLNLEPVSVLFYYKMHVAEEFGYIIAGTIELDLLGKTLVVKKD